MEADLNYEEDLRNQALHLQDEGPDAFKTTLKIAHENFNLQQKNKVLEQEMLLLRRDAHLIQEFHKEFMALNMPRKTQCDLILENRKLYHDLQKALKEPQCPKELQVYKIATHVLYGELLKHNKTIALLLHGSSYA